jgi:hypothetical protein
MRGFRLRVSTSIEQPDLVPDRIFVCCGGLSIVRVLTVLQCAQRFQPEHTVASHAKLSLTLIAPLSSYRKAPSKLPGVA